MKSSRLREIARWAGGELLQGVPIQCFDKVSTDTRKLQGGELFVALKGEKHDAHDYLKQAVEGGAGGLLVQSLPKETEAMRVPIIYVRDTLAALQDLARNYRRTRELPVVGITGSSGKTSTKDLLASILRERFEVKATAGNLNNHIGVPLTVLDIGEQHSAAIVEMGMSNPGEIELLAEIAQPTGAVITNVGSAHLGQMKTREAIAQEKGMLAEAIEKDGFVVLPAEDAFGDSLARRCRGRVIRGGLGTGDVSASDLKISWDGASFELAARGECTRVQIAVPAEHMVRNAVLAAAAGLELGLSLDEVRTGLEKCVLAGGRLHRRSLGKVRFLDDTYNANPESMRAALRTLAGVPVEGRRVAVLGKMAELGEETEREHLRLGAAAVENGIDILIGIGEEGGFIARGAEDQIETHVFADQEAAAAFLRSEINPEDLVLVKGSRSARMELVLAAFPNEA
jgi:UDP-N-acetylmuramoyl-tripeptide--D-alanyl-D-alanine ligase